MINELLLALILSTSFSVRTQNDNTKPLDYEFSVRAEKNEGNFTYNMKRDWERELGTKYVDDLFWGKLEGGGVYFKPEYMNKESKEVKYMKMDWRKSWKGVTLCFTTRSTTDELDLYETFASIGISKKKSYGEKVDIEITFDGYLPPDEAGDNTTFEYEDKFKVSYLITKKIRLYNLGEVSKIKGKSYYKGKIGIEITL